MSFLFRKDLQEEILQLLKLAENILFKIYLVVKCGNLDSNFKFHL